MYVCVHVLFVHICTYVYWYVCVRMYICTCMCIICTVCMYMYVYVCIYIYMCINYYAVQDNAQQMRKQKTLRKRLDITGGKMWSCDSYQRLVG